MLQSRRSPCRDSRLVTRSRLVWSGSGLKSTWMENAHFVEVERHPLYTRVREIFLKRGRELAVTVWDSNQLEGLISEPCERFHRRAIILVLYQTKSFRDPLHGRHRSGISRISHSSTSEISTSLLTKKLSSLDSKTCSITGRILSHCSSRVRPLSRRTISPGCTSTFNRRIKSRALLVTTTKSFSKA